MLDSYFSFEVPEFSIPSLPASIGNLSFDAVTNVGLDIKGLGISGSIDLGGLAPTLDPLDLIPQKSDIVSSLNAATTIPSILSMAGLSDEAAQISGALNAAGFAIDASGFPFQLSLPIMPTLRIPEIEWERRITALFEDMQALALAKITSAIGSVIPDLPLNVSIMGINLNLLDLAQNPQSFMTNLKGQLASQVTDILSNSINLLDGQIQIVTNLLSSPYQAWANACGVISPDLIFENVVSYAVSEVKGKLLDAINIGINGLFDKFPEDAGSLSFSLLNPPDIESLATGVINATVGNVKGIAIGIANQAIQSAIAPIRSLQAQIVSAIEGFSIFGFGPLDIIGGRVFDRIRSLERQFHRYVEALYHFRHNWRRYLTTDFILDKGLSFFQTIGLNSLIDIANFKITDFLAEASLSGSISLPLGGSISGSLSPSFSFDGIPSFGL
jgi:hypothetical protein